jgi:hypothetical protein
MGLAVAEAACGFEHRDLHWGNVLLSRDAVAAHKTCRLRCAAPWLTSLRCRIALPCMQAKVEQREA